MRMKNYTKPEIKFTEIRSKEVVAAECWKFAKKTEDENSDKMYYNYTGKGYVSFSISGATNCSGSSADNIAIRTYFGVPDDEKAKALSELKNWFNGILATSNAGSPVKGESRYSEETPDKWS